MAEEEEVGSGTRCVRWVADVERIARDSDAGHLRRTPSIVIKGGVLKRDDLWKEGEVYYKPDQMSDRRRRESDAYVPGRSG